MMEDLFKRSPLKVRHYVTINDVYKFNDVEDILTLALGVDPTSHIYWSSIQVFTQTSIVHSAVAALPQGSTEADNLWKLYILPKYIDATIGYYDTNTKEIDTAKMDQVALNFGLRFNAKLLETYPYYKKLLDIYTSLSDRLTAQLSTVQNTKYKILPQDDDINVTLPNDHKVFEELRDITDPAERLAKLNDTIRNLYGDWASDFDSLFIAFDNIGEEDDSPEPR